LRAVGRGAGDGGAVRAWQGATREAADRQTRTRPCFAGLGESAVPVRVGEKVVAPFEVGQVG
jgi:hypothetical protein